MEYAKKMALVDPRLLENVRAKAPSNTPIASVLGHLDEEYGCPGKGRVV